MDQRSTLIRGVALLVAALVLVGVSQVTFSKMHEMSPIVPGPGVVKKARLSDYFQGLAGTPGDTDVYIIGDQPGGTMLVLGNTHGIEPAGQVASIVLIENAIPSQGRLIVIPFANRSGLTWNEPGQGHPQYFELTASDGSKRWFRYGARHTNPAHQWPDPEVYIHYPTGQNMAGDEARNLNRAYPGKPDGTLTQKVAYGIMQLILKENVDIALDMHEAPPEKPLVDAVCAHENALTVAALATFNLEMEDIAIRLELSPKDLRGFSHREWGDNSQALAVLSETPNASQGALRGVTTSELVVEGKDAFYVKASSMGRTTVRYTDEGHSMDSRVSKKIGIVRALTEALTELYPDRAIVLDGAPTPAAIVANGVGHYLRPLK
jgi:hypothetical protein